MCIYMPLDKEMERHSNAFIVYSIRSYLITFLSQVNTCYIDNFNYQYLIYCIAFYETMKYIINKVTIKHRSLKADYSTVCLLDIGYRASLTG